MTSRTFFLLLGIGILSRLVPHPPNATAITAVAALAREHGAAWAYLVPLASLVVTDLFFGFYDWRILATVYGSYGFIAAITAYIPLTSSGWWRLPIVSSALFFLTTNTAVWAFSSLYPPTWDGLALAYLLGAPFFVFMLLGDYAYTALAVWALKGATVPFSTPFESRSRSVQ